MKLYSYYRSSASYRVRVALNYKNIPHEYHAVHLVKNGGEQFSPEYRALNPQSLVPTIVDDGFTLGQSAAILEYLEEKYPDPAILPENREERAFARQIAMISVTDIHPLNNLKVLNHLSGEFGISQAQKTEWYHKWIRQGFDAIEKLLEKSPYRTGPYCCGDSLSIADISLVPQVYNAHRYEMPMTAYPIISEIEKNCLKLKCFTDAAPENQPDTPDDQRPAFLKGKT